MDQARPGASDSGGTESGAFRKVRRWYRTSGVILLNTVVLVLLLNLVLGAFYLASDALDEEGEERSRPERLFTEDGAPVDDGRRTAEQLEWYDFTALQDVEAEHAAQVLEDHWRLTRQGMIYQSWVQFSSPPFDGELFHVDVDERGFPLRRTVAETVRSDRTRPDSGRTVRVFTLGGSTTFGEHVSDDHTWPSHLAEILRDEARSRSYPHRIQVRNYGRPYYHPTQEVALLADLLRAGHRPSLVILMDGVNLGGAAGEPHFKPEIAEAFIDRQFGREVTRAAVARELRWIPMVRFALAVDHWLDDLRSGDRGDRGGGLSEEVWGERVSRAVRRFRQNRELAGRLCDMYGCRVLGFLQPNPLVGYDLDLYRSELPESFTSSLDPMREFYARMSEEDGYIDLSHLFGEWGEGRKAIVDDLHYTPAFGRFLARHVAERVELSEMPVFDSVIADSAASSSPRSLVTRDGWLRPEDGWRRSPRKE